MFTVSPVSCEGGINLFLFQHSHNIEKYTQYINVTDMSSYGTLISASALPCNAVIETC